MFSTFFSDSQTRNCMQRFSCLIFPTPYRMLVVWLLGCFLQSPNALAQSAKTTGQHINGQLWTDISGQPINAHGGSMLYHKGKYYWYGEIKEGNTWLVKGLQWQCYRTNAGGVGCYSSKDLRKWAFEGVVLPPNATDSASDLHYSGVLERPKVIYNKQTKQFVLWLHIDKQDYSLAKAGVAVSPSPTGPFTYLGSYHPNGQMSRDMTVFKDDDEKAYLVYSSENNATMHICLLTDDYLQPTTHYERIFVRQYREAPALFKWQQRYYIITSACTGWAPNAAMLSVADSIFGKWINLGNPCRGANSQTTFGAQSTFVFPVGKRKKKWYFMADTWNMTQLAASGYVWLPISFAESAPTIPWHPQFAK